MSTAELAVPSGHGLTAGALLAGPRGRSLCVNVLDDRMTGPRNRVQRAWGDAMQAIHSGDTARGASKFTECTRIAALPGTPLEGSELMAGLQAAVDFAAYWEPPDIEDRGFAAEPVSEALRPVADAVAGAVAELAAVRCWAEPADRGGQRCTQFLGEDPWPEPLPTEAAESVAAWRADTCADDQSAHGRPEDPAAPYGGYWWSAPALSGLPVTTRRLPGHGAVGLALVEDEAGWKSARCWPVMPADGARVYEVSGPDQWAELVGRYPLDLSRSRRHVWWQASRAGQWLIPDYAAVAADWDAVHVSVAGYLTTAGVVIPAGAGACTMLAGWDPDATWWLNDVLSYSSTGPPEIWQEDGRAPFGWTQAQ